MNSRIVTRSIGAVTPYLLSIPLAFSVITVTSNDQGEHSSVVESNSLADDLGAGALQYQVDPARPDLIPNAIVSTYLFDAEDTYEAFIASEGWLEETILEGSVMVVVEDAPNCRRRLNTDPLAAGEF